MVNKLARRARPQQHDRNRSGSASGGAFRPSPTMSAIYSPLNPGTQQTRLLTILLNEDKSAIFGIRLEIATLNQVHPLYDALSYV